MRKKTAVEWLVEQLFQTNNNTTDSKKMDSESIIQQAKEMEKQQIINCFDHGDLVGRASLVREINPHDKVVLKYPEISAEQYYNETFKSE